MKRNPLSKSLNKLLYENNIIFNNDLNKYNILEILIYSKSNKNDKVTIKIDGKILPKSDVLLNNMYITPNFIDYKYYNKFSILEISGSNIHKIKISDRKDRIEHDLTYSLDKSNNNKQNMLLYKNKFAFIGDNHTYDSLKSVIDIDYISSTIDIEKLDVSKYDFLFCETTWTGIDHKWNFDFDNIGLNKILKKIVKKFQDNNKKCIFYLTDVPVYYDKFIDKSEDFDIIITSSDNSLKKHNDIIENTNRFDNINIKKIHSSLSFFCDPYKHNPIREKNSKKDNIATFIGGFYKQFRDRCNIQEEMFDKVLNYDIPFEIVNRFYFIDKLIKQISYIDYDNLLINNKYKKYNNPPVKHNLSHKVYKKSKLHININTVTDCKTMLSRRLIELLGCGANVYSNHSKSIDNFNLNVIKNINKNIFNNLPDINIEGFYNVHLNLSSVTFIENLYKILNLKVDKNIKFKIICNDRYICNKYRYATKYSNNECDIICYLTKHNYYYDTYFCDKLFVHLNYFQGNIAFTKDKNEYFTIASINNISNVTNIIIRKKNCKRVLYIPSLYKYKPKINILTRTSKRPKFFRDCIISINKQKYYNINHIVSYDNFETYDYLSKYNVDEICNTMIISTDFKIKYIKNFSYNFLEINSNNNLFNSSLVLNNNNSIGIIFRFNQIWYNNFIIYNLDSANLINNFKIKRYNLIDTKIIKYNNKILLIGHKIQYNRNNEFYTKMILCEINNDEISNKVNLFLNNNISIDDNVSEKNWIPIIEDNKLYFIYSYDPYILLICDDINNGKCEITFKTDKLLDNSNLSIRGSSNCIDYKDFKISIVHYKIFDSYNKFHYKFSFCLHEKNFPFKPYKYSNKFKFNYNYDIQFVNGCFIDKDIMYISLGINDKFTSITKIHMKDIINFIYDNNYNEIKNIIIKNNSQLSNKKKVIKYNLNISNNKNSNKINCKNKELAPYNLYLNKMIKKVNNGWIIILDDDDLFTSIYSLDKIVENIKSDNDLLLWKVKFHEKIILEDKYFGRKIVKENVCMCGFMFHSKHKNLVKFTDSYTSDFEVIKYLSTKLNVKWIDKILTKINYNEGFGGEGEQYDKVEKKIKRGGLINKIREIKMKKLS